MLVGFIREGSLPVAELSTYRDRVRAAPSRGALCGPLRARGKLPRSDAGRQRSERELCPSRWRDESAASRHVRAPALN